MGLETTITGITRPSQFEIIIFNQVLASPAMIFKQLQEAHKYLRVLLTWLRFSYGHSFQLQPHSLALPVCDNTITRATLLWPCELPRIASP